MGRPTVLALSTGLLLALLACSAPATSSRPAAPYPPAPTGAVVLRVWQPTHVVTDGTYLYVTAASTGPGRVERCGLDGSDPVTLATAAEPWGLALDGDHVYWSEQTPKNGLRRVLKSGGAPETLATDSDWRSEVAVDDSRVYWVGSSGAVMAVPKDAPASSPTVLVDQHAVVGGIALDATDVYWTDADSAGGARALGRVSKAGGPAETVLAGYTFLGMTPTSDGASVYLGVLDTTTTAHPTRILRLDTSTAAVTQLGESTLAGAFFSDGQYVYWTDDEWGVLAVPAGGGKTVRLASNAPGASPGGLTVSKGVVYWASSDGTIRSVRGPAAP